MMIITQKQCMVFCLIVHWCASLGMSVYAWDPHRIGLVFTFLSFVEKGFVTEACQQRKPRDKLKFLSQSKASVTCSSEWRQKVRCNKICPDLFTREIEGKFICFRVYFKFFLGTSDLAKATTPCCVLFALISTTFWKEFSTCGVRAPFWSFVAVGKMWAFDVRRPAMRIFFIIIMVRANLFLPFELDAPHVHHKPPSACWNSKTKSIPF